MGLVTIQKNWQELIKPNKLEIAPGNDSRRFATVVAEPLERGFGLTLGNALRRVLLSSLQGAAVKAVQIDGVLHEFSSIAGVREDVTDIILNIKEIALRMQGEGPKRMVVRKSGSGRGHRRRHPDGRRHRDPEPRSGAVHARRWRRDPHGVHRRHGQGLRRRRPQPPGRRADRADPGRQPLLAGQEGVLPGREHPRGPGARLRQADAVGRNRRLDPRRGCGGLRRAHPSGPALRLRQLRGAGEGHRRKSSSPSSPSTRRCSRRWTSWSCRSVRPTA